MQNRCPIWEPPSHSCRFLSIIRVYVAVPIKRLNNINIGRGPKNLNCKKALSISFKSGLFSRKPFSTNTNVIACRTIFSTSAIEYLFARSFRSFLRRTYFSSDALSGRDVFRSWILQSSPVLVQENQRRAAWKKMCSGWRSGRKSCGLAYVSSPRGHVVHFRHRNVD